MVQATPKAGLGVGRDTTKDQELHTSRNRRLFYGSQLRKRCFIQRPTIRVDDQGKTGNLAGRLGIVSGLPNPLMPLFHAINLDRVVLREHVNAAVGDGDF